MESIICYKLSNISKQWQNNVITTRKSDILNYFRYDQLEPNLVNLTSKVKPRKGNADPISIL
jgi:hypothetical protein